MGNRLQGHYHGYREARKIPFGEKNMTREIWVETMAQIQSSWQPVLRGFTVKQSKFQTKINLSPARGGRLALRPRWTSHAILPLIYHCIITHDYILT